MASVGRNEACPCGSGKKFKRCCLERQEIFELSLGEVARMNELQRTRLERFGHAKATISGLHNGYRFIAIGSKVHFFQNCETFPDFLDQYLKVVFNIEWWIRESKRPPEERHPVVRWAFQKHEHMKKNGQAERHLNVVVPDGPTHAYYSLSYDLYLLNHLMILQNKLLKKIRDHIRVSEI